MGGLLQPPAPPTEALTARPATNAYCRRPRPRSSPTSVSHTASSQPVGTVRTVAYGRIAGPDSYTRGAGASGP